MADPTKYVRSYDFTDYQELAPATPLPADHVDAELDLIQNSIDEIVDALADVRRSDGALKNGSVTVDSLSDDVVTEFSGKTAYATAVENGFSGTEEEWLESLEGAAATVSIGTVTTGSPGTSASVTNVGTANAAVLNFTIPRGNPGNDGLGTGDMTKATYDPTSINASAFDMANMVEAADAKVMTAAERTKLSGIASGAQVVNTANMASAVHGTTEKTSIVDNDEFFGVDSAASNVGKMFKFSTWKTQLKGYFDTYYQPLHALLTSLAGLSVSNNDLILGASSTTLKRLAKGSASQVLRVNSGATALEWVTFSSNLKVDGYYSGSGNWTCPEGVTRALVICIGGGAGCEGTNNTIGAGGWGGVAAGYVTVVPATAYAYSVGAGGAKRSSNGTGNSGGTTTFNSTWLSATGGTGSSGGTGTQGAAGTGSGTYATFIGSIGDGCLLFKNPGQNGWGNAAANWAEGTTAYGPGAGGKGGQTNTFGPGGIGGAVLVIY